MSSRVHLGVTHLESQPISSKTWCPSAETDAHHNIAMQCRLSCAPVAKSSGRLCPKVLERFSLARPSGTVPNTEWAVFATTLPEGRFLPWHHHPNPPNACRLSLASTRDQVACHDNNIASSGRCTMPFARQGKAQVPHLQLTFSFGLASLPCRLRASSFSFASFPSCIPLAFLGGIVDSHCGQPGRGSTCA